MHIQNLNWAQVQENKTTINGKEIRLHTEITPPEFINIVPDEDLTQDTVPFCKS